jgi:hypothetical protein
MNRTAPKYAMVALITLYGALCPLSYWIAATFIFQTFPVPIMPNAATIPSYLILSFLLFFAFPKAERNEFEFRKLYIYSFLFIGCLPLQIAVIATFVYFFASIGSSFQMVLGFTYPLVTLLFQWMGGRVFKLLNTQTEAGYFPTLVLGMQGDAFWQIFFFPRTIGWSQFFAFFTVKLLLLFVFLVRFSSFWWTFSGIDRKKLYMVSEAKGRFLEYRQDICTRWLFFAITETICCITFLGVGSFLLYGYNSEFYLGITLFEQNWTNAIIFAIVIELCLVGLSGTRFP